MNKQSNNPIAVLVISLIISFSGCKLSEYAMNDMGLTTLTFFLIFLGLALFVGGLVFSLKSLWNLIKGL